MKPINSINFETKELKEKYNNKEKKKKYQMKYYYILHSEHTVNKGTGIIRYYHIQWIYVHRCSGVNLIALKPLIIEYDHFYTAEEIYLNFRKRFLHLKGGKYSRFKIELKKVGKWFDDTRINYNYGAGRYSERWSLPLFIHHNNLNDVFAAIAFGERFPNYHVVTLLNEYIQLFANAEWEQTTVENNGFAKFGQRLLSSMSISSSSSRLQDIRSLDEQMQIEDDDYYQEEDDCDFEYENEYHFD